MEVYWVTDKQFPIQIVFGNELQKLTKKASFELEEKLADINLKLRLEDAS